MSLSGQDLTVERAGRRVLSGATLRIESGEIVGLLGVNGSGKSTLIRTLAGQLGGSGEVRVMDRPLAAVPVRERARLIAYVPQAKLIGWPLTVRTVVGIGRRPWTGAAGETDERSERLCREAMALMDVEGFADRPANQLSGGEQARVIVARAVAQDTPVLLADEPAAGLDPAHQMTMMQAFRRLARRGSAVLISMHDLNLAARHCDRLAVLWQGRIAADGPPETVLNEATLERYFGIRALLARDGAGLSVAPTALAGAEPS